MIFRVCVTPTYLVWPLYHTVLPDDAVGAGARTCIRVSTREFLPSVSQETCFLIPESLGESVEEM